MTTYNKEQRNNFLTNFIMAEQKRICKFLANNPDILAINLAEKMVYFGLPVMYIAAITGVPLDQLNKLQQIRH